MLQSPQAILFLVGAIQGLILSIAILFKSHLHRTSRNALLALILIITSQILLKVISKDWIGNYFSQLGIIAYQIPFLFGPAIFFFIRSSVDINYKFEARDILHLIPFVLPVFFILLLFLGFPIFQYLMPNSWVRGSLYAFLQIGSITYYHYRSFGLYHETIRKSQSLFSNPEKIRFQWLQQFIRASFITGVLTALTLFLMYNLYPNHQEIRYLLLAQGFLIYWITYKVVAYPDLFFKNLRLGKEIAGNEFFLPGTPFLKSAKKYAHNYLSPEDANKIKEKMISVLEQKKLFLTPNLNIDDFSKAVGESKHNVSRVINEKLNINFFDFINGYRIAKAKELLTDPNMDHFTIAAIAFECGFNSVSSFNSVFKKFESDKPSSYKKLHKKHAKG
jgi:AraC-like DNA-binding protein